jgi:hypothetical protein
VILAIDPGTTESGYAYLADGKVVASGVDTNERMLCRVGFRPTPAIGMLAYDLLAIEMIASYGMAVGREVFETCVWIGRFHEAAMRVFERPPEVRLVYRKDVKLLLCGSPRAKDANIRQALLDLLGPQGTKAKPGPTYGVKSHAWAALGVAVTAQAMAKGASVREFGEGATMVESGNV